MSTRIKSFSFILGAGFVAPEFKFVQNSTTSSTFVEVTPEALEGLTDAQQAEALARLKADLPTLMKELVAEAKEPTLWEKLKTYLA